MKSTNKNSAAESSQERASPNNNELDELSKLFLLQIKQLTEAYLKSAVVSEKHKTHTMLQLSMFNQSISENELKQPEPSLNKWKDRGRINREMSPIDFVKKNYPTLGYNLHMAHISRFDSGLATALRNLKSSNGGEWPNDFYLPTFSEYLDEKLDTISPPQLEFMTKLVDASKTRKRKMLASS